MMGEGLMQSVEWNSGWNTEVAGYFPFAFSLFEWSKSLSFYLFSNSEVYYR